MMEKKMALAVAIMIVGAIMIASSIVVTKPVEQDSEDYSWDASNPGKNFDERLEKQLNNIGIVSGEEKSSSPDIPVTTIAGGILAVVGVGGIIFLAKQSKESLPT